MISVKSRLSKVFANAKVDAILLMNNTAIDSNFRYLTGMVSGDLFDQSILIVLPNKVILFTDPREYAIEMRMKSKEMQVLNIKSRKQAEKIFKKYFRGKIVGINGSFLSYNRFKAMKKITKAKRFVDVTKAFYLARSIKDKEEIKNIRKANKIIKRVLNRVKTELKEGMTEIELAKRVDSLMVDYGASGNSFSTIVCFGETSAVPHHMPENIRLKKNSFVLIDCGSKYNNYCSDVTKTFIFKPDRKSEKYKQMVEMYGIVKEAQTAALKSIKPGVKCEVPHVVAQKYIDKAMKGKYKGKFVHSLGHAIGIDVHDLGPNLTPSCKEKIKENMIFSDEPGIYINGFGGVRIEDDILVTKKGAEIL